MRLLRAEHGPEILSAAVQGKAIPGKEGGFKNLPGP